MTSERQDQPVLRPADLSVLERTYLGVLDTGIIPARLAGDQTLRMDYITAVCLALREGQLPDTYLQDRGPEPNPDFLDRLNEAARSLDAKGVISAGPPPPDMILSPDLARPSPPQRIDFDQHPRIWDRYLAHACMEELFQDTRVYPFLMGKYQDSSDVWSRLYRQNPDRFR